MSTDPSPAELQWRISWLAGLATAPSAEVREPAPEPEWLRAPTVAELEVGTTDQPEGRRSLLEQSIRELPGDGNPLEFGGTLADGRTWVHPPYGPAQVRPPHPYLRRSRWRPG